MNKPCSFYYKYSDISPKEEIPIRHLSILEFVSVSLMRLYLLTWVPPARHRRLHDPPTPGRPARHQLPETRPGSPAYVRLSVSCIANGTVSRDFQPQFLLLPIAKRYEY